MKEEAGYEKENCIWYGFADDEFLSVFESEVQDAAKAHGVNIDMRYAENDSSKIIQCIESAAAEGKDAVLINMVAAEDAQGCIEAAGEMKVVFINRIPADTSLLSESVAAVASDESKAGAYQGEYLVDYFKEKGKTDVKYIMLQGTPGMVHTELRTIKAIEVMKEGGLNPLEATETIMADYDRVTAKESLSSILKETEFDCIIANNDAMALGAILAMEDAGMDPASVPIVGIDATADGKQALKDGKMAMTVYQDAQGQADGAIAAAINMLEEKNLIEGTDYELAEESEYIIYVPFVPVTADNVDEIQE